MDAGRKDMKLTVAYGLPASGKTTLLTTLSEPYVGEYFDFDSPQDRKKVKSFVKNLKQNAILDFFLTDVNNFVDFFFECHPTGILEIYKLPTNIDVCLERDLNRRTKSSEKLIKTMVLEEIKQRDNLIIHEVTNNMSKWKTLYDVEAFEQFKGKTVERVEKDENEKITFYCEDGWKFYTLHDQDCCESVYIADSETSNFSSIVGQKIVAVTSESEDTSEKDSYDSETTTKYYITTENDAYVITWVGSSNGYYSESPSFYGVKV